MATKKREDPQDSVVEAAVARAATMAAAGFTGVKIAQELGVSESTVSRWRTRADFQQIYNTILREAVDSAAARLRQLTLAAVDVLKETVTDPRATPADRIRAATVILERVIGDSAHESKIGPTDIEAIERKIERENERIALSEQLDRQFNEVIKSLF